MSGATHCQDCAPGDPVALEHESSCDCNCHLFSGIRIFPQPEDKQDIVVNRNPEDYKLPYDFNSVGGMPLTNILVLHTACPCRSERSSHCCCQSGKHECCGCAALLAQADYLNHKRGGSQCLWVFHRVIDEYSEVQVRLRKTISQMSLELAKVNQIERGHIARCKCHPFQAGVGGPVGHCWSTVHAEVDITCHFTEGEHPYNDPRCVGIPIASAEGDRPCLHPDCDNPGSYCNEHSLAKRDLEPGFFGRAAARLQKQEKAMLADIYAAWLALADSDIEEADRLLIKWVEIYRTRKGDRACQTPAKPSSD